MPATQKNRIILLSLLIAFLSYSFILYISLPVKNYSTNPGAATGKIAWQKYNCNACHQVYGLGGYLGPDLTNVYSQKGKDYIEVFLKTGTVTMPNFHLTEQEVGALLAFLKNIDASGTADPKTFTQNNDGTIEQQ